MSSQRSGGKLEPGVEQRMREQELIHSKNRTIPIPRPSDDLDEIDKLLAEDTEPLAS